MLRLTLVGAAALLVSASAAVAASPLKLAITVDDLPVHGPTPVNETPQLIADRTIAAFQAAHVTTVTGFVNGQWSVTQPSAMGVLTAWRKAGLAIGNHSWSHANLGEIGDERLLGEIGGNEGVLNDYSKGGDWHWFRHPFLAEGKGERRLALRRILAQRYYHIAAVTMDFSDWQWTAPYARCVAAKDDGAIAELKRLYLQSAREDIASRRFLSQELYGRDIPYVLLMHIGALDSYMLPQLLALYREAGFSFVSLKEAEHDRVYREDVDPRLPPRESSLDGRASLRRLPHPAVTDFAAKLASICPAPSP